jgi:N-acetylmuramidase
MSFFDDILKAIFGGKKAAPTPAPAPKPAPKSPPPVAAAPRPPVTPPPPPPVLPPPPATAATNFSLEALKATDATPLSAGEIEAAAGRLGVEAKAIRAIIQVESAGKGFAPDGRPMILYEPTEFSELTNRRFDSGYPEISMAADKPNSLGATQADRWTKLTQAFELDQVAALQATSWGLFQMNGENHAACGYANVFQMVADLAQSEGRQLACFEAFVSNKNLGPALNAQDWVTFARAYGGHASAEKLGQMIGSAYSTPAPAPGPAIDAYLAGLKAKTSAPLSNAEVLAAATRMNCEPACVRAVLKVESRGSGFGPDGRPVILYEPHIFSRLTARKYDQSNPTISYVNWKTLPYPKTQAERYDQLAEAYKLDPENAVASASWGLFQILGSNFKACGFASAKAFVADMAQSEARMLAAFEAFVRSNGILDELQRKDWAGFAKVYNGPGQVETYSKLLSDAYAAAKAQA